MSERDPTPVAVTSRSFSRNEILRAELLVRYERVTFNDEGLSLAGDSLVEFLAGHPLAITALEKIDEDVLSRLPDLRAISKVGVGIDMLDLDAMERHGVRLAWSRGTNARSVSELALAFMLALLRQLPAVARVVREGEWRQVQGQTLSGRKVGIVGFGHVGRDLAQLLGAFSCRVLAHDVVPIGDCGAGVEEVGLEQLLAESEIVTLHTVLNDETRSLINRERLAAMREGALLINTSRGGLVDGDALYEALCSGRLAGAALDVFTSEPPGDHPLLDLDQVIVTPHIGGSTREAVLAMGRAAIDGLSEAVDVAMLGAPA
ncbi:MAG TPA: phosphoglycerate dehydrogenase [Solirubrobacteraceae bacterium]|nr:phosphoglycerate dehydrogenase [Solirubrobacteraceae bacterium]